MSRQGAVVIQATRDFTVKTVQTAANIAVQVGSRLYTDSASSYRAAKDYVHHLDTMLVRWFPQWAAVGKLLFHTLSIDHHGGASP